jgi:hypothetical protein
MRQRTRASLSNHRIGEPDRDRIIVERLHGYRSACNDGEPQIAFRLGDTGESGGSADGVCWRYIVVDRHRARGMLYSTCAIVGLRGFTCALGIVLLILAGKPQCAEASDPEKPASSPSASDVLTAEQWNRVDAAVDRGLAYLVSQQQLDGSIAAPRTGQPGITALAVMALLSRGHTPGEGRYGAQMLEAIDFVRSCQRSDGLLSAAEPEPVHVHEGASHTGNYNHAIAGLMLTEVYGMLSGPRQEQAADAIRRALRFSRREQTKPRRHAGEQGGWRYLRPLPSGDADISMSSWQLMFYRSARNAEFDVPTAYVDEALAYIRRGFDHSQRTFTYNLPGGRNRATLGVAGGGIVSLALGGEHQTDAARQAGDWVLTQSFDRYNVGQSPYHYGAYYCSQAMFQLGGEYWLRFYPPLAETLIQNQSSDGSWEPENDKGGSFGRSYTTSLAVLALTPAYQLLPIFQR